MRGGPEADFGGGAEGALGVVDREVLREARRRGRRSGPAARGAGTFGIPETGRRGRRAVEGVRLPYMPGLDGLRALAVVAVLLYHAGLPWIPGGFLGVDVFFVISGYLITSLLLTEWGARGRVDLKAFWVGRARRLLPAAALVISASLAFAVLFLPGEVAGLRGDALASLGYVTNWYLIFEQESYFEAVSRPSLLRHLWSLAVEEQFYLLWPPILALGLGVGALRYRRRRLVSVVLAGAAASAVLMASLYDPGVDPSRVYYGTDTRAAGLLVGAALAFVWIPGQVGRRRRHGRTGKTRHRRWGWTAPLLLDALGLAALGGLVWAALHLDEYQPFLYRGGFGIVAVVSAALVASVVYPRGRLGARLLSLGPLRWVGMRSYGIYLWHWPVFMVSRPDVDVPLDGTLLLVARLAVTLVLAELSYRFVETPIRRGALGRTFRRLRETRGARRWRLGARVAGTAAPVLVGCVALGLAVAHAEPPKPPAYLSEKAVRAENSVPTQGSAGATEEEPLQEEKAQEVPAPKSGAGGEGTAPDGAGEKARPQEGGGGAGNSATFAGSSEARPVGPVTAVGDSVMLGAVDALGQGVPNLALVDARGSRQVAEAIAVLRDLRAVGKLGDVVVVHVGNNGVFTDEEFDEMMGVLSGTRKVLFVNTTVPEGYGWAPNNEIIAARVRRHPDRAVLVDWHAASAGHPEYFWDGLHLTPQGAKAYVDLISAASREQ